MGENLSHPNKYVAALLRRGIYALDYIMAWKQ